MDAQASHSGVGADAFAAAVARLSNGEMKVNVFHAGQLGPIPEEIRTCRTYLEAGLAALTEVRVVIALGQIAHVAAARALRLPPSGTKFGHGAENEAPDGRVLLSSYHCSRYNQNTRKLDAAMFESVFARALTLRAPA